MNDMLKREMQRLNGFYYGMLTADERELVEEACKRGIARREWNFLGLSKVFVV